MMLDMASRKILPRAVVLRHDTPDPGPHLDLMIQPADAVGADPDEHRLITFRLPDGPDPFANGGDFPCQKLPDHRIRYLAYEGDIGGNRGSVRRLVTAEVQELSVEHNRLSAVLDCESGRVIVLDITWDSTGHGTASVAHGSGFS